MGGHTLGVGLEEGVAHRGEGLQGWGWARGNEGVRASWGEEWMERAR